MAFVEATEGFSPDRLIHVAPSLDRIWTTNNSTVKTVLPVGAIFHMGLGRLLVGRELLALQGIPYPLMPCLESFTDSQLMDLAGNAYSGPVIQAVFVALMASLHFQTESEDERDKSVAEMMALMKNRQL